MSVSKGSSMVRYPFCSLPCTLAKQVKLFPGLGLYSGIFVMYLQCQSNGSTGRMATSVFYAICLLYVLATFSFISDLILKVLSVSNISICSKNIIFYQLCRCIPVHFCFPLNNISWWLWLPRPMYLSTHKSLYLSSALFTQIFKDLPLLDRVGSKYLCGNHSFILVSCMPRSVNLSSFDIPISIYSL